MKIMKTEKFKKRSIVIKRQTAHNRTERAPPAWGGIMCAIQPAYRYLEECTMEITQESIFYHIYPLGFCGAPANNDFSCAAGGGLRSLEALIPHLKRLGVDALYVGPLFESGTHGYDTLDYYHVDRRC
jgi:hypothetical protein